MNIINIINSLQRRARALEQLTTENRRFPTFSVDTRGAISNMSCTRSPERRLGAAPPGIQSLRGLLGGAGPHIAKKLFGRHSTSPSSRKLNPASGTSSTLNNLVHASMKIIARRPEHFYPPTNTVNYTTTRPSIVSPISAAAPTTLATERGETCRLKVGACPHRRLGAAPPGIQSLRGLLGGAGSHISTKLLGLSSTPPSSRELNQSCCAERTPNNPAQAEYDVCDDANERSCDGHCHKEMLKCDQRSIHFSTQHHPTRPPGPRPKKKRMSLEVSRQTGRFGMSYHQIDYDRFEKAELERKRKAMLYELYNPDSPPLPTDEFYNKGEIPEVDPIPTLQWWRLCSSGKKIEGHTFGEPSRSVDIYPEGMKIRLCLSPSINTTALAEGS